MAAVNEPAHRIRYDAGNPHAPDDPFGRTLLIIERTGLARLGNWHRGGTRAWSGSISLDVIDEVLGHLTAGGFPDWRPRSIVPGAVFTLTVETNPPQSVMDSTHSSNPEYRAAVQLLDGVIRQLSSDVIPIGRAPDRMLVLSSRSIPIEEVK